MYTFSLYKFIVTETAHTHIPTRWARINTILLSSVAASAAQSPIKCVVRFQHIFFILASNQQHSLRDFPILYYKLMGVKPTIDTQSVKFMFFIAAHLVRTWFHVSIWLLWYEICCAQHTCEKDGFIVLHPARYYLLLLLLLQASNVTSTHNNKKTCEINASVKRERKISHAALHNKQTLMQRHNNNMRKRTVKTYFDFFF